MKRIRYVSQFSTALSEEELEVLAEISASNNSEKGITGLLVASGQVFYQLIEGPDWEIDRLYATILEDPRHRNVVTLSVEQGSLARLCPDWHMQVVDLNADVSAHSELAKASLDAIVQLQATLAGMVSALEEYTWKGILEVSMKTAEKALSPRN